MAYKVIGKGSLLFGGRVFLPGEIMKDGFVSEEVVKTLEKQGAIEKVGTDKPGQKKHVKSSEKSEKTEKKKTYSSGFSSYGKTEE